MDNETIDTTETGNNTPDTTSEPMPETSGDTSTPIQVVSVDELVERLTSGSDELSEADGDVQPEDGEVGSNLPSATDMYYEQVLESYQQILVEVKEIKREMVEGKHPALTTNFADYTVTESLLLLVFLYCFGSAVVRMVKGAFHWLAW